MSLQVLRQQFVDEAPSGRILIDTTQIGKSGLAPPSGLDALLKGAFMLPDTVTGITILEPTDISPIVDNVFTLAGKIDTPIAKDKAVTARFTTDGNTAVFQITVTLGEAWKFKDSFIYMAGKVTDALPLQNQFFVFSTNTQASFPVNGRPIALAPGLNLSTDVTLTSVLARILDLFANLLPNVARPFNGPIDPSVIGTKTKTGVTILTPTMDLKADLGIGQYAYAFLTLDKPFLRYATEDYGPKYAPTPTLSVAAALRVTGGNPVTFEATLPVTGDTYSFAVFGTDGGLILSLRQLFDLMAGRTWYDVIPPELLQFLGSFGPKMFSADIIPATPPKVPAVSAQVGSDPNKPWVLLDGLFTIDGFDVWWTDRKSVV